MEDRVHPFLGVSATKRTYLNFDARKYRISTLVHKTGPNVRCGTFFSWRKRNQDPRILCRPHLNFEAQKYCACDTPIVLQQRYKPGFESTEADTVARLSENPFPHNQHLMIRPVPLVKDTPIVLQHRYKPGFKSTEAGRKTFEDRLRMLSITGGVVMLGIGLHYNNAEKVRTRTAVDPYHTAQNWVFMRNLQTMTSANYFSANAKL